MEWARVHENPSADEIKALTPKMPNARWTRYGNLNVQTKVLARSTPSTFIVTDDPDAGVSRTIVQVVTTPADAIKLRRVILHAFISVLRCR